MEGGEISPPNNDILPETATASCSKEQEQSKIEKFLENQNIALKNFLQQQSDCFRNLGLGYSVDDNDGPRPKKSRTEENDDALSLHPDEDEDHEDNDPWASYSKSPTGKGVPDDPLTDDDMNEHIEGSKYQALLEKTIEQMGDPIDTELATVCGKVWGKAMLSKKKKEDIFTDIIIPSNCQAMMTPKLNTEIYIRLIENAQTKDRVQDRQKDLVKASVPLFHAMEEIGKVENFMLKKPKWTTNEEKETYNTLKGVGPTIQKSLKVLNYSFTETLRKRKYDVTLSVSNLSPLPAVHPLQNSSLTRME